MVFFGRLIPGVRSLISLPAGMDRMPMARFLVFTTLGTVIWNALLAYAGVTLGENWQRVLTFLESYERAVIVIVVASIVAYVFYRFRHRFRRSVESSEDGRQREGEELT